MRKHYVTLFLFFLFTFIVSAFPQNSSEITIKELNDHIYFLASDSLKGRKAGTNEGKISAEYIRDQFKQSHLKLLGEDGFQYFSIVARIEAGKNNQLTFDHFSAKLDEDFTPLAFSANRSVAGKVAFVGYGFDFDLDSLSWHDYQGIDVSQKWCMILRGDPEIENINSPFVLYSSLRKKALVARDHGAVGVLFVSGKEFNKNDELIDLNYEASGSDVGIPIIHIKRYVADSLLKARGETIESLEKKLNKTRSPQSFVIDNTVKATTDVIKKKSQTQNVVGLLAGSDPVLKDEYIILGAHYDHLGMGGPGSGSRRPDTLAIHNGADDNASGTAAVVEIIEKLAAHRKEIRRSVVVVAFDAEEIGALGSKYFTNHPLIDLKKIKFMFNLDMVGRLNQESEALTIGGTGTAKGLSDIVEKFAEKERLKVKMSPEGYGPSDHASFYVKDIPVLMFFTGAHEDYHTPNDDPQLINYKGLKTVSDFVYDLLIDIANRDEALTYQEAGPKARPAGRRRFKVTLGIMPDHAATDIKGLRVDLVIKGKPAALAGMQKGDIIIAMEGNPVNDIYDYMNRLTEFKVGQRISVEVLRNGQKKILIVQL